MGRGHRGQSAIIICSIIGAVIFLSLLGISVTSFAFAFIPAIAIPAATIPDRNFDAKFKDGVCIYQRTVAVVGPTQTEMYPEFTMYRRGQLVGTGVPFRRCGGGRHCRSSGSDGQKICERRLKHVNCHLFKTPTGQIAGPVDWNQGEYRVGHNYSCEISEKDLSKVSDQIGCTTWPHGYGCVMMDRSNVPNAISDKLFWGLLIGFVFVPLGITVLNGFLAALSLMAFLGLGIATWGLVETGHVVASWCRTARRKIQERKIQEESGTQQTSLPAEGELDVFDSEL